MNGRAIAVLAMAAAVLSVSACGSGGGDDAAPSSRPTKIRTSGESVSLTVDGVSVPVEPDKTYSCKESDGVVRLYNWSDKTPTPGPTAAVTVGKASSANEVAFGADGVRYSVAANRPGTSATGSKNGDLFVVEGLAQSWDVTPELTKKFRITFTCHSSTK